MRRPTKPTRRQRPERVEPVAVTLDDRGEVMIDSWEVYRSMVALTESAPKSWSKESTPSLRLVHHLLGIVTEIDELFRRNSLIKLPATNYEEELGDLMWYLASLENVALSEKQLLPEWGIPFKLAAEDIEICYENIMYQVPNIADLAKRLLAYGIYEKNPRHAVTASQRLAARVVAHAFSIVTLIHGHGGEPDDEAYMLKLAKMNIEKLSKRFPEGFTVKDAVERKLKEEAKVFNQRPSSSHHSTEVLTSEERSNASV